MYTSLGLMNSATRLFKGSFLGFVVGFWGGAFTVFRILWSSFGEVEFFGGLRDFGVGCLRCKAHLLAEGSSSVPHPQP